MEGSEKTVRLYEELAERHARQNEKKQRDLFLVLAADAAWSLGRREEAERLRRRLLVFNPHHLLKPFASFAEAQQSPDVQLFVADLRRQFPPETAEQLREGRRPEAPSVPRGEAAAPAEPELKVYHVKEGVPATPAATPPVANRSGPAARQPLPAPGVPRVIPRPPSMQNPYAQALDKPSSPRKADDVEWGWLALVLFLLVLLGGLALTAYTLLRPAWDL